MVKKKSSLKLGKGSAFVKSHLKRLPQVEETWEVDFLALPKPMSQSDTHYLGVVVGRPDGILLTDEEIRGRPSVNDLARLVAHAMSRPLDSHARRPRRLCLRGHAQWRELFPHLEQLGVEVVVGEDLTLAKDAYRDYLKFMRELRRKDMPGPTPEQSTVEELFPSVARWVLGGHIEIGDQEMFGFVARALDYGGLVVEEENAETLAEAMAALDRALARWFEENG